MSRYKIEQLAAQVSKDCGGWVSCRVWPHGDGFTVLRSHAIFADIKNKKQARAFTLAFVATRDLFHH